MEEELYLKLDEDGGNKMILKMARDRTIDYYMIEQRMEGA